MELTIATLVLECILVLAVSNCSVTADDFLFVFTFT
jgi:hypothetical protein